MKDKRKTKKKEPLVPCQSWGKGCACAVVDLNAWCGDKPCLILAQRPGK